VSALVIGPEVPAGDFEFRVHSAFASAMNLAVADRRGLVTLVGADADDHPQGIRLASAESVLVWTAPVGTRGRREGARLVFDDPAGGELFAIDLATAVVACPRALPYVDPRDEAVLRAWAVCAAGLDGFQTAAATDLRLATLCGGPPASTLLGERLAQAAGALGDGLGRRNLNEADRAASRLVGLGTGLTPTGDDFLCGILAALRCTSREDDQERRFAAGWGAVLGARLEATTAVGATFLACAIAGSFAGAVSALVDALADGREAAARRALERLCAQGHSSGMDTATGLLFGLWLRNDGEVRRHAPRL
jgi:hypothetical protein